MKVLLINGNDYAAMDYEDLEEMAKQDIINTLLNTDCDEYEFNDGSIATIHEFGDVDSKFIDFIVENIQDYDQSKHTNFYVIEE